MIDLKQVVSIMQAFEKFLLDMDKILVPDLIRFGNATVPREVITKINRTYPTGNKIQRIKMIRELTDLSLKEAKDVIEEVWESARSGSSIKGDGYIKSKYKEKHQ